MILEGGDLADSAQRLARKGQDEGEPTVGESRLVGQRDSADESGCMVDSLAGVMEGRSGRQEAAKGNIIKATNMRCPGQAFRLQVGSWVVILRRGRVRQVDVTSGELDESACAFTILGRQTAGSQ